MWFPNPPVWSVQLILRSTINDPTCAFITYPTKQLCDKIYWDGGSVANGIYFYQFRAGDYTALRRMVILK